ncbi:MAG: tyrosine-protein phosphatase [Candidatus Eremiobacteraeota bacterium]|nr:tyrosine-protein phosphatase [Candidatus Eremiobacteraeota bacterium]MCW5869469.1 tyrosine-protein phosphatase [Candidatus Eremiobacteraeota bacterium]
MPFCSKRSLKLLVLALLAFGKLCLAAAITLEGTKNTRDLGGLPVAGGRLRNGRLYRSGALCFATPADVERLAGLRLRTVVDLRTDKEIAKDGADRIVLAENLRLPMTAYHGRGAEAYRSLVLQNGRVLREFFGMLARSEAYPVIYHCSAGKDRVGILTALLLDALGTPREVIMDDYLQSRRNSPKLEVHEEWLEEVFAAVDRSGGTEAFLAIQGIPAGQLEAIRNNLTEAD